MHRPTQPASCWTALRLMVLLLLGALGAVASTARGDGKIFSTRDRLPTIPGQQALLVWDGRMETLVIDTEVLGTESDLAWVIPTPAIPTVEPVSRGVIQTCVHATGPAPAPRPPTVGDLLPILIVAPAIVALLLPTRRREAIRILAATTVVLAAGLLLLTQVLGTARGGLEGLERSASPVIAEGRAGEFDFTVLGGTDASAIVDWLRGGGFAVPESCNDVMTALVQEGWSFVAGRRRVEGRSEADPIQPPHPILLRFRSAAPIYPMRLTGAGAEAPLKLRLLVAADGSAAASNLATIASLPIAPVNADAEVVGQRQWGRALIGHPDLLHLLGASSTLTRLEGELQPHQMTDDVHPKVGPQQIVQEVRRIRRRGESEAILFGSIASGLVLAGAGLLAEAMRWTARNRLAMLLAGLAAGLLGAFLLSGVEVLRLDRAQAERLAATHASIAERLRILLAGAATDGEVGGLRGEEEKTEFVRDRMGRSSRLNPLVLRPIRECDSPGDWTLHTKDGLLVYRWYDVTGRGFDEILWPPAKALPTAAPTRPVAGDPALR